MVLIIGMRDDTLSVRLQLESDLKLETAVNIIRKSEDLVRQKQELNLSKIDAVNKNNTFSGQCKFGETNNSSVNYPYRENHNTKYIPLKRNPTTCFWCGKYPLHNRNFALQETTNAKFVVK
jgi:hypothetical protein